MIKLKRCGFCGKSQGQFQHLFDMKDKNKGIPGTFFLDKCKNCGLMFLNPQPSYKELERYYPKDKYYSLLKIVAGKKSKIRLFLYDLYFNPKNSGYLKKICALASAILCPWDKDHAWKKTFRYRLRLWAVLV